MEEETYIVPIFTKISTFIVFFLFWSKTLVPTFIAIRRQMTLPSIVSNEAVTTTSVGTFGSQNFEFFHYTTKVFLYKESVKTEEAR